MDQTSAIVRTGAPPVIAGWLVVLVAVGVGAVGVAFATWRRRDDVGECGTVSDQWLADQRANDRHYSER